MARIHPEVLEKLAATLDVGTAQVYRLVAAKAGETHLPRHLAALVLAGEHRININKKAYATDEERAQIRGAPSARPVVHVSPSPTLPARAPVAGARRRSPAKGGDAAARKSNSVMVVYGRDSKARDAMFAFLRAIGLQPIEWPQAVKATKKGAPYVGEVLDVAFKKAAAVVVLLTPDDEGRLRKKYVKPTDPKHERELTGQPRLNVIFEAGRAFGSHPDATILVQVRGEVRPFSDTAGVHFVHLTDAPEPRRDLANRLEAAGCATNTDGTDWLTAGHFSS